MLRLVLGVIGLVLCSQGWRATAGGDSMSWPQVFAWGLVSFASIVPAWLVLRGVYEVVWRKK